MGKAKTRKRGYISKFLKKADKAINASIKNADNALQDGIKKADEVLDTGIELGIISAKQAKLEAAKLRKQARKEIKLLQKQAEQEAERIRDESKKKIQKNISKIKRSSSSEKNLQLLEKLGKLRKTGIITEKEFKQKKKHLLKGI